MVQSFVRTVRAWRKHVQAFLLASTIGAAVLVPCASLAQNLGTTPATGQAVQGQTASQPEGAFLNAVNWLCNVICPVGAGIEQSCETGRTLTGQRQASPSWRRTGHR
jgi:hypothetical protein